MKQEKQIDGAALFILQPSAFILIPRRVDGPWAADVLGHAHVDGTPAAPAPAAHGIALRRHKDVIEVGRTVPRPVIVVAATNRAELIDPALLRPGRFDLVVELGYPNEADRRSIFAIHTKGRPLSPEITVEELARLTEGRSGADIEAICRRAALLALREWIAPKLNPVHVQVTEATNDDGTTNDVGTQFIAPSPSGIDTTNRIPTSPFQIRLEHFERAIDEQRERYAVQELAEDARARKEAGRQRLIDMAADYNADAKPRLRGFRLWLARLFGLAS